MLYYVITIVQSRNGQLIFPKGHIRKQDCGGADQKACKKAKIKNCSFGPFRKIIAQCVLHLVNQCCRGIGLEMNLQGTECPLFLFQGLFLGIAMLTHILHCLG